MSGKWPKIGPLNWSAVLSVGGLVFGALSALLVARGVLFRSPLDVLRELEAFGVVDFAASPGASRLLHGLLTQRLDTLIGCILLAVSFVSQAAATFVPEREVPRRHSAALAALACVVFASVGYFGITRWSDAEANSQAITLYEDLRSRAPESWRPLIDERVRELRSQKP